MARASTFALGLVVGGAVGASAAWLLQPDRAEWTHYRNVRDFASERFVRAPDRAKLADDALRGMLAGLDRYSRYYDAQETAAMERETGGRYRGIGVVLKRPIEDGRVLFPLRGSPAERQGVRVGDRIVELDGRTFTELDEPAVREVLSRDTDEPVRMTVVGLDGARRELVLARESVVEPTLHSERMLDAKEGIAYMALHSFSRETASEFDAAWERLARLGMRSLVLDLRGNGGGTLASAIAVARRFVPAGLIVSTENRREVVPYLAAPTEALHAGTPLVVLVDEESASASEVLAGALQDHRAAVVVGAPTWGKGTVQTILRFPDGRTSAKVTTSFYYTPAHRNLEHGEDAPFGIAPDVLVESIPAESRELHAFLERQMPPLETVAALRAWEEREHVRVVDDPPADRALACAVDLLRGRRPDVGSRRP